MTLRSVNDASIETELSKQRPILLHFWAEWCGPCRMISPFLHELSNDFASEVEFLKINVDENPVTAQQYGIMSIPSLILFKEKKVISRQVGAAPKAKIAQWLQSSGGS